MSSLLFRPESNNVEQIKDPDEAISYIEKIYAANTAYLRQSFELFLRGDTLPGQISAHYPYAAINVRMRDLRRRDIDPRSAYGFVTSEGRHYTTLTRPDIFGGYYREMLGLLIDNHQLPIEVGVSETPIPIHFAFPGGLPAIKGGLTAEQRESMQSAFSPISLNAINDNIVDGKIANYGDCEKPLALYTAPRVDISLQRLRHYTGTDARHFQKFVLFTNYQFYVDEFRKVAESILTPGRDPLIQNGYTSFVEPGNHIRFNQRIAARPDEGASAERAPQMPAYHLTREDGNGITLVNIGVGPSNAKNITDHIAVLRPHVWIMVGHAAGLRPEMNMGDFILADAFDRQDRILDGKLPQSTAIPAIGEVLKALTKAVEDVTGLKGDDVRRILRTGTVISVQDRNWEFDGMDAIMHMLNPSRPVALDMETAPIAANGFRHSTPYGAILRNSDMPIHGWPKLPGEAQDFYGHSTAPHLLIAIKACEMLRENIDGMHRRKLRTTFAPAFR